MSTRRLPSLARYASACALALCFCLLASGASIAVAQSAQPDSGPVADAAAPSGSAAAAPTESQQTLNESSPRSEPTARDRQGAAEAYDRGTAAYLRGD